MNRSGFVRRTLALLTPHEKRRGLLVLAMMVGLAVMETVGVASVMPFLAVLGNPDLVETNAALRWMYETGGFETVHRFLFVLGLGAFVIVVISAGMRIATTYAVSRFVYRRAYSLSARVLQAYLRQPYAFFLNRNSADMSKSVLSEVGEVTTLAFKPGMELISYGLVAASLVGFLVVVDPVVAVLVALVVGLSYAMIYLSVRGLLRRIGQRRVVANRDRYQAAGEAFGGIKDLKVLGREGAYLARYRKPAAQYARYQYLKAIVEKAPRYLIEAVAFGGILGLALFLMATREDLGSVLPLLGLYAFAGYRLIPASQKIFSSLSSLRYAGPAVEAIHEDLSASPPREPDSHERSAAALVNEIRFDSVSFRYPGAEGYALEDLNLVIPARTSVGFVGSTGAGKTTAVDLVLGLLETTEGEIRIDGRPLEAVGIRSWQKAIGYVPQNIYLADGTVSENITFGIDGDEIDQEAVERAAHVARIHDFVTSELPAGYDTVVGERGIRLSGGQRQRIGIARSLYHDPQVLVFDEATSALDTATERAVMEAVEGLRGEKTVIIIAHRLSTVERCDRIVVLDAGRIVGVGAFEELKASNQTFRKLAVV
jgi:ATP-binding cassette, subfamily B, bacterial PglK